MSNSLNQYQRELLIQRYLSALEKGNMLQVAAVMEIAEQDSILEEMIWQLTVALARPVSQEPVVYQNGQHQLPAANGANQIIAIVAKDPALQLPKGAKRQGWLTWGAVATLLILGGIIWILSNQQPQNDSSIYQYPIPFTPTLSLPVSTESLPAHLEVTTYDSSITIATGDVELFDINPRPIEQALLVTESESSRVIRWTQTTEDVGYYQLTISPDVPFSIDLQNTSSNASTLNLSLSRLISLNIQAEDGHIALTLPSIVNSGYSVVIQNMDGGTDITLPPDAIVRLEVSIESSDVDLPENFVLVDENVEIAREGLHAVWQTTNFDPYQPHILIQFTSNTGYLTVSMHNKS